MNYPRPWRKCLEKVQQYETLPIEQWNHYQLLGYVLVQTSQKFEPVNVLEANPGFLQDSDTSPSRHPMIECMRYVFRQFNNCPNQTKTFLDWCISKYKSKLSIGGLRNLQFYYINHNKPQNTIPIRTDVLSTELQTLFTEYNCKTYGDLAFMRQDDSLNQILVEKLDSVGLTIEKLKLHKIT